MKIPVDKIIVKKRIRADLGSVENLKKSIKKYGLLNPIIINKNNVLVAGERRYRAVQALKWREVEVRVVEKKDTYSNLNMEIEENLHRKNLTYDELERAIRKRKFLKETQDTPILRRLWNIFVEFVKNIYYAIFKINP
ncbi:ParB N-terminal domain-containing protein [Spirochaetota bacterium]